MSTAESNTEQVEGKENAEPSGDGKIEGVITCPYCQDNVPVLLPVEPGMRLRLQRDAQLGTVPEQVCEACVKQLTKSISKGAALRAEQVAKEQNRINLWRNRIQLVKQGKLYLSQKNFSDAAVAYEKYIRVLEIVYELQSGELTPEIFKNQSRQQELTVIAGVFWDLMRVYDTHPTYRERQFKTAEKLAEFVRFTPIFPNIVRKAETQTRQAKNPEAFRKFLRLSNAKRPRCFIATAAFDSYHHPVVIKLCAFRDQYLRHSRWGRRFITLYYRHSPRIAAQIDRHPRVRPLLRVLLTSIARCAPARRHCNSSLVAERACLCGQLSPFSARGTKQNAQIR